MTLVFLAALYPIVFLMMWVGKPDGIHTGNQMRCHAHDVLKITVDAGLRAGIKSLVIWALLAAAFKAWDINSEIWSLVPLALAGAIFDELYRIWDKPSGVAASTPLASLPLQETIDP